MGEEEGEARRSLGSMKEGRKGARRSLGRRSRRRGSKEELREEEQDEG